MDCLLENCDLKRYEFKQGLILKGWVGNVFILLYWLKPSSHPDRKH